MRFYGYKDKYLGEAKDGEALPEKSIRAIVIETPKEEQALREFLNKHLSNNGSNALTQSSDASNGSRALGEVHNSSEAILKLDYSLEDKLQIIDTLASALKNENSVFYDHTKETEEKLLALIRSI